MIDIKILDLFVDTPARELWSGTWFGLAATMVVALLFIIIARIRHRHELSHSIHEDMVLQLSIGLIGSAFASMLRAGYVWIFLHCKNLYGPTECEVIADYNEILSVAGILSVIAGVCIIRVMSPSYWRPWLWLGVLIAAAAFPVILYSIVRLMRFLPPSGAELVLNTLDRQTMLLSLVAVIVACWIALWFADLANRTSAIASWLLALSAAAVLSIGVWGMHFIGMLAIRISNTHGFILDRDLTVLSIIIISSVSLFAVLLVKSIGVSYIPIMCAGVIIGLGAIFMHYLGIAAMWIPNIVPVLNPLSVIVAAVIAVASCTAVVWLMFTDYLSTVSRLERRLLSAIAGGLAMASMHYVAMAGTTFYRIGG